MITYIEHTSSWYAPRTKENAKADATIAFAVDFTTQGEILTKDAVKRAGKIYIPIDANKTHIQMERVDKLANRLEKVKTLNIAGNSLHTLLNKYTQPQADQFAFDFLLAVSGYMGQDWVVKEICSGGQTGFDEAGIKAAVALGIPARILCPKGWRFRDAAGRDIYDEKKFKARFNL